MVCIKELVYWNFEDNSYRTNYINSTLKLTFAKCSVTEHRQ